MVFNNGLGWGRVRYLHIEKSDVQCSHHVNNVIESAVLGDSATNSFDQSGRELIADDADSVRWIHVEAIDKTDILCDPPEIIVTQHRSPVIGPTT